MVWDVSEHTGVQWLKLGAASWCQRVVCSDVSFSSSELERLMEKTGFSHCAFTELVFQVSPRPVPACRPA